MHRFRWTFPNRLHREGQEFFPKLRLDGLDPNTRTPAVTLEDLTRPLFGSKAHWVAWNIPSRVRTVTNRFPRRLLVPLFLSEGVSPTSRAGIS